jgi:TatD DNase family protein
MQPTLADKHLKADPIREYLDDEKLVAIGEVGLDYYWVKEETLRAKQELLFISAIDLANEVKLPLVIHSRKAESECLDLLEQHAQVPVLLHSFDGNLKQINRALDLGYLISVPTNVTRRKNRRKVTVRAGIDNIVLETDAPFCQPREEIERNEPQYIPLAAQYMAKLLELELDEFSSVTSKNTEQFYKI